MANSVDHRADYRTAPSPPGGTEQLALAEEQLILSQERMFALIESYLGRSVRSAPIEEHPDEVEVVTATESLATRWPAPDPATILDVSPSAVVRVQRPTAPPPAPVAGERVEARRPWVANAVAIAVILAVMAVAVALINLF